MPLPFTVRRTDPDAAAFCARSGASDRAAVSAFVRGVKDLGLWESMVCWPLRSEQNAGTGTTAYSLGGLGTFNGTLVNGPTWGANGIAFTDTTQVITRSGFDTPPSPMTFGAVNDKSNTAAVIRVRFWGVFPNRYSSADSQFNRNIDVRNQNNTNYLGWPASAVNTDFIHKAISLTGNLTADAYFNGSFVSPNLVNVVLVGWDDASGASTELIGASNASDATIRVAFFFATSGLAATASQHAAFYTLYRATLGTGLSLP
jgi:hypothetical protein